MLQQRRRKARKMATTALQEQVARYRPTTPEHLEWFAFLPEADRLLILEIQDTLKLVKLTKPKVNVIGNVKGGVGKTTTTVNLSVIFSFVVPSVLLVDADGENRQSLAWSMVKPEWPQNLRVVPWAGVNPVTKEPITPADLSRNIAFQVEQGTYSLIFVDTGPQIREYIEAALAHADDFIITTSHRPLDKAKVGASVDLSFKMEEQHRREIAATILIADTKKASAEFRDLVRTLDTKRIPRFLDVIPSKETFSNAPRQGMPRRFDEYAAVALQLAKMWAGTWEYTFPEADPEPASDELAGELA